MNTNDKVLTRSDRIHNIRPNWLRKILTMCLFGPFSLIMLIALWCLVMIVFACYHLTIILKWWWHDYVVNVWTGEDKPDKYQPLDL